MKVAVINFSGNVGKTTIARQLLGSRMEADEFAVETINAGASDENVRTSRIKGKDFGDLQEDLMLMETANVDVGASNAEDFVKLMAQFSGSHEEFDFFVVPVVSEKKQQADTINTIKTLSKLGSLPKRFGSCSIESILKTATTSIRCLLPSLVFIKPKSFSH